MAVTIVLGGQYGSEGKGSVTSWLSRQRLFDLAIRTGGSNAGHSFIDSKGELHKMRQIPCSWDAQKYTPIFIPAGAVIKPSVFFAEMELIRSHGYSSTVWVSPQASIVTEEAEEREQAIKTGSTKEGIGATRALKCVRQAPIVRDSALFNASACSRYGMVVTRPSQFLSSPSREILLEATQGFALSLNYGHYPYCTSTDLTPYQLLQDAEIPFGRHEVRPVLVLRTYPIRIAGDSGYMFKEISWGALQSRHGSHIPVEQTTVTKKTRRVGEWDAELAHKAVETCFPSEIVLTFFDYLFPEAAQFVSGIQLTKPMRAYLHDLDMQLGMKITYLGVGIGKVINRDSSI